MLALFAQRLTHTNLYHRSVYLLGPHLKQVRLKISAIIILFDMHIYAYTWMNNEHGFSVQSLHTRHRGPESGEEGTLWISISILGG